MGQAAHWLADQIIHPQAVKLVTAAATLAVNEQTVEADGTSGNYAITLPSASEAAGRIYAIWLATAAAHTVTINSPEVTPVITAALTADADSAVAYSDGNRWYLLNTVIGGTRN